MAIQEYCTVILKCHQQNTTWKKAGCRIAVWGTGRDTAMWRTKWYILCCGVALGLWNYSGCNFSDYGLPFIIPRFLTCDLPKRISRVRAILARAQIICAGCISPVEPWRCTAFLSVSLLPRKRHTIAVLLLCHWRCVFCYFWSEDYLQIKICAPGNLWNQTSEGWKINDLLRLGNLNFQAV